MTKKVKSLNAKEIKEKGKEINGGIRFKRTI